MDALLKELIEHGGLIGLVVVVALLAVRALYTDGQHHQSERVKDAQAVVDRILALVKQAEESKRELVRAIDENTEATRQLAARCPGTTQLRR